jgi:glucose/arabinose dehydrogenase
VTRRIYTSGVSLFLSPLSRILPAIALAAGPAPLAAQAPWPEVRLVRKIGGLSSPVHLTHAGDRSGRLFVVEQRGRIRIIKDGALLPEPFLDITGRVSCCGERGLLSAAFGPHFGEIGDFYVDYTDLNGDTTISRFSALPAGSDTANPASEQVVLKIPQPFSNHNGGQLAFGPDGYLYVGTGDGGSGGDPQNNAQNAASLLGKILRIDVQSGVDPYLVPSSNPFVGNPAYRPEIWALGLRNPWRFSFDRVTRDLWIGDVGQSAWEEVDFQPASSRGGANYGWRVMEGNHCYNPATCSTAGLVLPVAEYPHSGGDCSVTGGFRYRGLSYAGLYGIYFYADYCTGRLRGLRATVPGWESHEFLLPGFSVSTFGEDEAGELYLADYGGGALYQVTDAAGAASVLVVPVVVDVLGAGGAHFASELTLGNRGSTPVSLAVTYTPAASLGASGGGTVNESLGVGRQETIPDAVAWLRQKGLSIPLTGDQGGSLRIVATGASAGDVVFASVRTTAPAGIGRAGLAYPALGREELADSSVVLFSLRETADFRSNLGLVNAGDPAGGRRRSTASR